MWKDIMNSLLSITKPFDFEAMLKTHGWFQLPPFYWSEGEKTLHWATALDDGEPFLLHLSTHADRLHEQILQISGDAPDREEEIIQKVRHVLNLDLDLSEFYAQCANNAVLQEAPKRGIGRIMRSESLFEDVFKSICGTNVQWNQAVKMIANIAALGKVVNGTTYYVFPTPLQIAVAGETFLKDVGRVGYRSRYLIALAERFLANEEKSSAEIEQMSYRECRDYFNNFMGIGKVTARYLTSLYGHFEELAIDCLVIKYMSQRHFGGRTPSEQEIHEVYAPFGQWQYLAYWMEFIINGGWVPNV
jgi:3-methyladenine DNA glycosylase/8-oxoguanine DNA glycosylase